MEKDDNKKSNLEDIMINSGDSQKQLKKILMIVALVIVILIVVIAVTKIVIGGNEEVQPVPTALPAPAQQREPLFEEVPIESVSDADDELSRMINQLRDSEMRQREIERQQSTQTPPLQSQPQQQAVREAQPQQQPVRQAQAAQPVETSTPTATQNQKHDPYQVKNGWYVQVGSFSRFTPNQAFLKNIQDKGYSYYFHRTDMDGTQVTKVLIGVYATRDEAIAHRTRIKDEINEGAFLLRVTDGI